MTKILLKARPTRPQLRDRLADPVPDGLELYLDPADLTDASLDQLLRELDDVADVSRDFVWIVEAPIRTLGGQFFDLSIFDGDHRETLRRVTRVGRAIGAVAANVHVVAPSLDSGKLDHWARTEKLARAADFLCEYVASCLAANVIPQVENVPPVGRMREGAFVFSPIGAAPEDLTELGDAFPELRFTLDVSHAGLYLNWCSAGAADHSPDSARVAAFYRATSRVGSLIDYARALGDRIATVHVSNAGGLYGEGLRYADGEFDLDGVLRRLSPTVPFLVTETLEADPDRAVGMRDAQARLLALRDETAAGAPT